MASTPGGNGGRLMAFGGGGYSLENLSAAWCAVLEVFARN